MKLVIWCVLLYFGLTNTIAQGLNSIVWMSEEYPPYNFVKDGKTQGVAVDLLVEMWNKAGLKKDRSDINIWEWRRGVGMINEDKNSCLFSTTITKDRKENLGWKFVYPIPLIDEKSSNHLIAKKSKKIKITSASDLKNITNKIGAVTGDVGVALAMESGVSKSKIDEAPKPDALLRKLAAGRNDMISYGWETAEILMKKLNINPDDYEIVYSFPPQQMGYAFHKDVDPTVLQTLQKALDELTADGTAKKILEKYK